MTILCFLEAKQLDEKAVFFELELVISQEVVRGVVTQIYRNGLAAISTNYQDGMHCFVNLSDVVKVLPKSHKNSGMHGFVPGNYLRK